MKIKMFLSVDIDESRDKCHIIMYLIVAPVVLNSMSRELQTLDKRQNFTNLR